MTPYSKHANHMIPQSCCMWRLNAMHLLHGVLDVPKLAILPGTQVQDRSGTVAKSTRRPVLLRHASSWRDDAFC